MYICNNCGKQVDDLPTYKEARATTMMQTFYEEMLDDECECGGTFEEGYPRQCEICGYDLSANEYCVCDVCLAEEYTVHNALKIGDLNREKIDINGFVAWHLSADQINHILEKWVTENVVNSTYDVIKFLDEDKSYFADFIVEQRSKEKDK